MILCYMLRKSKTIAIKKIKDKQDSFTFESGKYFVEKDRVFLKKTIFGGFFPCLFYIEGISEPLSLNNIQKQKRTVINEETGEEEQIEDETVLINAFNIHDLTSSEMLRVLVSSAMSKADKIVLALIILNMIISIGIGVVASG